MVTRTRTSCPSGTYYGCLQTLLTWQVYLIHNDIQSVSGVPGIQGAVVLGLAERSDLY